MTIYKDCLGRPDSKAIISVFGANHGQPGAGYLVLSTTSDCPEMKWPYTSRDVTHIVKEMESKGWECKVSKDGYNAPVIDCVHIETQKLIDGLTKQANDKFANAERGYIRFGDCPKSGRSYNHRDNIWEAGVSVFEAEFAGKDYRVLVDSVLQVSYLMVADRPAYRIYGKVVGTGADGEPVLKVTKKVRL